MVMQVKSPVMPITERRPPIMPKRCGCLAFSHSLILNQPRKCRQNKVSYTFIWNCNINYSFQPTIIPNTIHSGFWRNFQPSTIHSGFWQNFHSNPIPLNVWCNFKPYITHSSFLPNFQSNSIQSAFPPNFHHNTKHWFLASFSSQYYTLWILASFSF